MSDFKDNVPKSISAGTLPQTSLVELTALPQAPYSWNKGNLLLREGMGAGRERRGEEETGRKARVTIP